jgi:hypothetical protein
MIVSTIRPKPSSALVQARDLRRRLSVHVVWKQGGRPGLA